MFQDKPDICHVLIASGLIITIEPVASSCWPADNMNKTTMVGMASGSDVDPQAVSANRDAL